MFRKRNTRSALLTVWLVGLGSTVAAFSLVSVNQEIQIGREAQAQVRSQVPELRDGTVNSYIDSVGRRLAARASGPRYPYDFSVANLRDVNAFALPGGPVWVHRGAIQAARNEAQLAAVLAHEIGHIAQRHAASRLTKSIIANGGLSLLGAVLGNNSGGDRAAQIGAGLFAQGLFLKFSRDDEREADRIGMQMMSRGGWNPRGMVEFMQVLREQQGRDPSSVEVFMSSHPSPRNRVQALQRDLKRYGNRGRMNSERFNQLRARLARMAPAPAGPRR